MAKSKHVSLKEIIFIILLGGILLGVGYGYIRYQDTYPSTEDAYIHGNLLYIAPQVSGKLVDVLVEDFQHVDQGMVVARIDPKIYQAQLDQAKAVYQQALATNKAGSDAINAASADVVAAKANLEDVQKKYDRDMVLVRQGSLSKQTGDDLKDQLSAAENNLNATRAKMQQLINQQGAKGDEAPAVKQAAAALAQATLNLSYTDIIAPVSGQLGALKIRKGSVVASGQALMPLIQDHSFWVQANYKENDVARLKPGMYATIVMDMYPDVSFSGRLIAISPASGSSFSLLPPENATGNWVKVPQRFPVRLSIESKDNLPQLRVGANATVTIDTREMASAPKGE